MRSLTFLFRAILLSFPVGLRMIPIILAVAYGAFLLFSFLFDIFAEHPFVLLFVSIPITWYISVFVHLMAVRCGLVQLKASGPPIIKKLLAISLRYMFFQFIIYALCMIVIGVGVTGLLIYVLAPEIWQDILAGLEMRSTSDRRALWERTWADAPLFLYIPSAIAPLIGYALIGTNTAALCATAAVRGPQHDLVWGLGAQFKPLFFIAVVVTAVPGAIWVVYIGDQGDLAGSFNDLPVNALIGYAAFSVWSYCIMAAGMALGYSYTLDDMEREKAMEQAAFVGHVFDKEELRELRAMRQAQPGPAAH